MSKQNSVKKQGINLSDPSTFQVDGLSGFKTKPIVFAVGNQDGLLVRVIHKPVKPTVLEDNNWVLSTYEELQFMRREGKNDPIAQIKRRASKHIAALILCKHYPKLIGVDEENTFVLGDGSKLTDVLNEARNASDAKWRSEIPVHQRRKFEAAPPKRPKMPEVGLLASVPEQYRNLCVRYLYLLETTEVKNLLYLIYDLDTKQEVVKNMFEMTVQRPIHWATGMSEAQVRGSIARIISDGTCAGKIRDTRRVTTSTPAIQAVRSTMQKTDKVEGKIRELLSKFNTDEKDNLHTAINSFPMPSIQSVTQWKDDKIEKSRSLREDYMTEYHRFQEKLKASALARDKYRSK